MDQVLETLPSALHDKFPTTYAIIDDSETFIETPSDLHMQLYTWINLLRISCLCGINIGHRAYRYMWLTDYAKQKSRNFNNG